MIKLVSKYLNPSKPIRKTRILFTPEQMALFESQSTRVPGMNNSGGNRYREEGVLALQYLEQEAKRKEEEIKSRSERPHVLKRKASFSEKLRGGNDEYEQTSRVIGMSGRDPLLGTLFDLYVGGKGLEAAGKLGLWGAAKYAPSTLLGNWGRGYFISNEMKLVNPLEQTAKLGITLRAVTPKATDESSTSLKFFERPSKISETESLGFGRSRGFNPESGSDLHEFYALLDRRQAMLDALRKLKTPENMGVDETISKNSGSIIEDGYLMSNGYRYTPVGLKYFSTGTNMSFGRNEGLTVEGHNYGLNLGGESTRVRDLGANSKIVYSGPKANLDRNDPLNLDVVITAENNEANKEGIKLLTKGMRDMESGAEFSGDASTTTTAENLYRALKQAKKSDIKEYSISRAKDILQNNEGYELGTHSIYDPIHEVVTENATMSPDAYSYFLRTAKSNPDKFHLGYQMNAGNFNSFARNPKNSFMYNVEQQYLKGEISPEEYVNQFNKWITPLGGRRAYIYNGQVYKPQPFLIRNKQGGKL